MNFFDAYDVPGSATPPADAQPTQSLNEEVTQVVGQLSRLWGGFRKQSQAALETARKDLGEVVQQAQKELTKLTAEAPPSDAAAPPEPSASATEQAASIPSEAEAATAAAQTTDSRDTPADASEPSTSQSQPTSQPQTLFARLQASLPPALVSTVQTQLPETLRETLQNARVGSASLSALDFAQLRSTITSELQRVQGATEEYVHRSEDFLREAGEFLKDAVKVVPPEAGDEGYPGLIWDGTDVWMLPSSTGAAASPSSTGNGKGKEREGRSSSSSGRPSVDTLRAVATRAESMLKQLRHDPEVIKADPHEDEKVRELFAGWLATEVASEEHGLGTAVWQKKVEEALADPADGAALKVTMDTLVPEVLTHDEFWTRYFFRVYQVEREEARRKAIIQGTIDNDEDFSWEDEEEDATSPTTKSAPHASNVTTSDLPKPTQSPALLSASAAETRSRVSTPGNMSPRQSSEDSYDVVSSQVSNSGAAEAGTEGAASIKTPTAQKAEEGGEDESEESDWE